ncbi:MAG: glycosyl transferase family 1 [Proteobacteria bacterium]|nr:MAG: glycosyl transferase family 1 [Pseudomonadota bacterium]
MRVLLLAPQPFFQERGTPIAVRLAATVLSKRAKDQIDLLTYHEGSDLEIANVQLVRIYVPQWLERMGLKGIGPGVSIKKLMCDLLFAFKALRLVLAKRYDMVHAVEESVFLALLFKWIFKVPYIYDMDSSLALQVTEKWYVLKPLSPLLNYLERLAVKHSLAVVPVCDALAAIANRHGSPFTQVLHDISLLNGDRKGDFAVNLRNEAGLGEADKVFLYIGNLEAYQGIDLMLESFALAAEKEVLAKLVVIGGREEHIELYRGRAERLGISDRVRFLGTRPVSRLNDYLLQADYLVSPRVKGNNTPMKIYSYLHSGKPVIATDLPTHSQVMDSSCAKLAAPDSESMRQAMLELLGDPDKAAALGEKARALAEERYTFGNFERTLSGIYDKVAAEIA